MSKLLRILIFATMIALVAAPVFATGPTSVFISEYVEGSSNNKALEIYNNTGADLDMTRLSLQRYNNGALTPGYDEIFPAGTLAAGGVYVIVNAGSEATLLALGDATMSTATFFNGDDDVVLLLDGAIVDYFGRLGEDPGSEWGVDPCSSNEHSLRRKITVCSGDTNGDDAFDPADEWDCFDQNDYTGLGSHTVNCGVPVEPQSFGAVKSKF